MKLRRIGVGGSGQANYSAPWKFVSPMEPEISRLYGGIGHPALCYSPE